MMILTITYGISKAFHKLQRSSDYISEMYMPRTCAKHRPHGCHTGVKHTPLGRQMHAHKKDIKYRPLGQQVHARSQNSLTQATRAISACMPHGESTAQATHTAREVRKLRDSLGRQVLEDGHRADRGGGQQVHDVQHLGVQLWFAACKAALRESGEACYGEER
eukprot:scaffold31118_cov22-Tisochrysis_lutea.AAC.3